LNKHKISAAAIHGNKSQGARTRALAEFKNGEVSVLVATDIAARGIDIDQLPQVVNFDLPNVPEDYVHRIGRTGRAGATGQAVSLVSADEIKQLSDIERLIQKLLPRELVDGFEPIHDVPESTLRPPSRPKKPKKPRVEHKDGQRDGKSRPNRSRSGNRSNSNSPRNSSKKNTAKKTTSPGNKQSSNSNSNSHSNSHSNSNTANKTNTNKRRISKRPSNVSGNR